MTRFEMELTGALGSFWQREAVRELEEIRHEIADGKITFDADGVAYNCIGRVVMDDIAEKINHVSDKINMTATRRARDAEAEKSAREYRERMQNHKYSDEELFEMRAAFGTGTTIVDVITGNCITL